MDVPCHLCDSIGAMMFLRYRSFSSVVVNYGHVLSSVGSFLFEKLRI
jgi:hypothetical protein